jgi:hypothetical protein
MTYNPFVPQPTDIPAQSQNEFFFDFSLFNTYFSRNHTQLGNSIVNATLSAPIVITSAGHALSTGNMVTIYDMQGLLGSEPMYWPVNGSAFTITVIDVDTFSLNSTDSTSYPPYIVGTGNFSSPSYLYGYHTQLSSPMPVAPDPSLPSPFAALYSKIAPVFSGSPSTNPDLFFKNFQSTMQLTRLLRDIKSVIGPGSGPYSYSCSGVTTPWGIILNFGTFNGTTQGANVPVTIKFSTPYVNHAYAAFVVPSSQNSVQKPQYFVSGLTNTTVSVVSYKDVVNDPKITNSYFLVIGS